MHDDITLMTGLPEQHRAMAARLYYAAFRQKLHPIFRDETRGRAVLEQCMDASYAIVALHDDQLAGIAGFKDSEGSLMAIQPSHMTATFGVIGGWSRLLALAIFERPLESGTLLMDGIVVSETMRGRGIGSRLLEGIIAHAREQGYEQVRLDVVDTNPRARQLYERRGFIATETQHYPFLRHLFGFSASTTMLKRLRDN